MWGFNGIWMMLPPESQAKAAKWQNQMEFQNTFMAFMNLSLSTFEWTGLPETCNERYLELALLTSGMAAMAKDEELGYIALRAMPTDANYNIYGEVASVNLYGFNGFNKRYSAYMQGTDNTNAQAVICRDNPMVYPYVNYCASYGKRVADLLRSHDVAVRKLKIPYFIQADQSQVPSIKKVLSQVEGNEDEIVTSKGTTLEAFKVFPTNVNPGMLSAMWDAIENIEGRFRTIMGIQNAPNNKKKERLIQDEVNSNNQYTDMNIDLRLRQREIFCQTVNEMFGLNVSVKLAEPMDRVDEDVNETGGDEDVPDVPRED